MLSNQTHFNFSCIYAIINIINGKIYIGSAINFRKRRNAHERNLKLNKHHSIYLQRAYNKYGKDNFKFDIIEEIIDKKKLLKREQMWMNLFKPQYNIAKTAGSMLNFNHRSESKEKMSISRKGSIPWNKGKTFEDTYSQEKINQLKKAMSSQGRVFSSEHKKNISIGGKGKIKINNRKIRKAISLLYIIFFEMSLLKIKIF